MYFPLLCLLLRFINNSVRKWRRKNLAQFVPNHEILIHWSQKKCKSNSMINESTDTWKKYKVPSKKYPDETKAPPSGSSLTLPFRYRAGWAELSHDTIPTRTIWTRGKPTFEHSSCTQVNSQSYRYDRNPNTLEEPCRIFMWLLRPGYYRSSTKTEHL